MKTLDLLKLIFYPASLRLSEGSVPTEDDLKNSVHYDRVLILGVDGAGSWFKQCKVPNFHRIFDGGSITYEGWSQQPTISAHTWTSVLHGVRFQKHKITNSVAASKPYTDNKYPSIFKVCAERDKDASFISAATWPPINIGMVENIPSVVKITGTTVDLIAEGDKLDEKGDINMKTQLLDLIKNSDIDPKITYVHISQVDMYGHEYGSKSNEYSRSVEVADAIMGEIYDAFCARGWKDSTLFIAVTDHGHRKNGGHGLNTKREREVTVAVNGNKGNILSGTPGKVTTQDVASITLYALGVPQPSSWESKVPHHMFTTLP